MDPSGKKICRYCKREFNCGRGLGGHIRVHFKGSKMTKFSHKKKNSRRGVPFSEAETTLRICNGPANDGVAEDVNGGGASNNQEMSTSITAPKLLHFDLNELPPDED